MTMIETGVSAATLEMPAATSNNDAMETADSLFIANPVFPKGGDPLILPMTLRRFVKSNVIQQVRTPRSRQGWHHR
ncbi:hypothetical protein [Methylococcus sp. Mc7]|uniref:hypothetical protein n=1 Tax=Methylococcus sp. Mc7 TaxID=2860258 RepID=UPI001C52C987|nr:hypothetical protein [Methylococcus sp. Mc7]QXP85744.1 hypothetical protein KW115_08605 [Methylococcus sp. Mc7]